MSTLWNYRLVKHPEAKSKTSWYGVHEVFYNDEGNPWVMTRDPIRLEGGSAKDVLSDLKLIQRDLRRSPVLDVSKMKWAKPPKGIRGGRSRKFTSIKDLMKDLRAP